MSRWFARALVVLSFGMVWALTDFLVADEALFTGVCQSGAQAKKEMYCGYFKHYRKIPGDLDSRLADNLGIARADQTRSIGLVIVISDYSKKPGYALPAAKIDGDNLERFLIDDQSFDEVIVLRDVEATQTVIDYFLTDYIPNRATEFRGKARVLIAFSGHGRPDDGAQKAAFLLSGIDDVNGSVDVYPMQFFGDYVGRIKEKSFHVLTLINACYGGSFFNSASPGGDADKTSLPGSYALTAGPKEEEVPSLNPKRGSLFFDLLIDGVRRGWADPSYWDFYALRDGKGDPLKQHGITRLGALNSYLTSAYDHIGHEKRGDATFRPLVSPWFGPAQTGVARGGFFFLSDAQIGSAIDLASAYGRGKSEALSFAIAPERPPQLAVPAGPASSIVGRPDVKVFKQPEVYPIKGFDLSSADGKIDWRAFSNAEHPRFLYARAVGWRGLDPTFGERWSNAKELGIDRGAYFKFDFCKSAEEQLAILKEIYLNEPDTLPLAIELVTPTPGQDLDQGVNQVPCYEKLGRNSARDEIVHLAESVGKIYGKVPLLFGNRYNLSELTDERSDAEMIWLGAYTRNSTGLAGRNPWTLWQYSGSLNVKGIGPKTTGSVFFGTEEQYVEFKQGRVNVALRAVQR